MFSEPNSIFKNNQVQYRKYPQHSLDKKTIILFLNKKIDEYKGKFGFKIDKDFSLIVLHEFFWEYDEFNAYDMGELEEAAGKMRNEEEAETSCSIEMLSQLMQGK